ARRGRIGGAAREQPDLRPHAPPFALREGAARVALLRDGDGARLAHGEILHQINSPVNNDVKPLPGRWLAPQGEDSRKVSQRSGAPVSRPRRNQCTRCSDEPCVKPSGWTSPVVCSWTRSSPIAAAAFSPSSTSPRSRMSRWPVE